jgi:serine/threonine protein kinase
VVFTIPSELNPLVSMNRKVLYDLLFRSVSDTLTELANDPKHLGAEIGSIGILHTWGQNLLHHPHIVQVVDFDIEGDMPYIVMELVEGMTLKAHIKNLSRQGEIIPLKKSTRILREVGQALAYAHYQNMVHRDVKASNVIIEGGEALDGRSVLTDFGLVKIFFFEALKASGRIGFPVRLANSITPSSTKCRGDPPIIPAILSILDFRALTNV